MSSRHRTQRKRRYRIETLESRRLLAANISPSFTAVDPPITTEDGGEQVVVGFATFDPTSDPGAADESDQSVLNYQVTHVSHPDLFAVLPSIDTDGQLSYTPAEDAFGNATFDVTVQDDGGTSEGGVDTSASQSFTLTITGVNDAPSFLAGGEVTVLEDAGPQVVTDFATAFDPGPGEAGTSTDSQVLHDEGSDGFTDPLSTDNLNPTDLGSLALGSNVVSGLVENAQAVGNVDVFTFVVEPGFQWSGLWVDLYEYPVPPSANERNAFLAINDGDSFPYDTFGLDFSQNPDLDESLFLGGTIFGLSDLPAEGGGNILPRAGVITGRRFTGPLPAGTYTIYLQQTGPASRYGLDFQVTESFAQTVAAYSVTNVSDPDLFSVQPFVNTSGDLSFTPASDALGTATFDVTVQDSGGTGNGTGNGGMDTSAIQQATLTITGVNDRPSLTLSALAAIDRDAGPQTVAGFIATASLGPENESSQSLMGYEVSQVSDASFFASLPAIDSDGNLTYTVADRISGTVMFDVTVQDDGGIENGGVAVSVAHSVTLTVNDRIDFGDAPAGYPVTLVDDGARHAISDLRLGGEVDAETDGTSSEDAGIDGVSDDGITRISSLVTVASGVTQSSLTIEASADGHLDAWIDFNADGDWDDAGEQIATDVIVSAGNNTLTITVPAGSTVGETAARFRISSLGSLSPRGFTPDGEVEDYLVSLIDGDSSPQVVVHSDGTETVLSRLDSQLQLRGYQDDLFAAPIESVGSLQWKGTDTADRFTLDFSGGDPIAQGGLSLDGMAGQNTLRLINPVTQDGIVLNLVDDLTVVHFASLDLSNGQSDTLVINTAVVKGLSPLPVASVVIQGDAGDVIDIQDPENWQLIYVGTVLDLANFAVSTIGGDAVLEVTIPSAWHNLLRAGDINNNGDVTAADALLIINELGRRFFSDSQTEELGAPGSGSDWPDTYYDQNNDGRVTALDALRVINELARVSSSSSGEGESDSPAVVDALLSSPMVGLETRGHEISVDQPLRFQRVPPTVAGQDRITSPPSFTIRPQGRAEQDQTGQEIDPEILGTEILGTEVLGTEVLGPEVLGPGILGKGAIGLPSVVDGVVDRVIRMNDWK